MSFINKIIDYMKGNNYQVDEGPDLFNIVYIEGANADGTPNADRINEWNDRRIIFQIEDGKALILGNWAATSEPGKPYTDRPMNPKGAARIQFGQYRAWSVGMHGNSFPHESLLQVAPVTVCRDFNRDGFRTGDKLDTGLFGINQHSTNGNPDLVGKWSAGCLVGRSLSDHRIFMQLVKSDRRFCKNSNYVFRTTIIDATKL
jgi:hypothetical protein